jgi:hypothetical protein
MTAAAQMTTSRPRATRDECARPDFSGTSASNPADIASEEAVSELWRASWAALRAVFPDIEQRLAQIEHQRPTRARALERLAASAGRAAGRCLRKEAKPSDLLRKLLVYQSAVLTELEKTT